MPGSDQCEQEQLIRKDRYRKKFCYFSVEKRIINPVQNLTGMAKYIRVSLLLAACIALCAAMLPLTPAQEPVEYKNLKVLPKDISHEELSAVMDAFTVSLGVKCNFCHAMAADTLPKKHLDFAADSKPEKETAREMMKMTAYLNQNFFNPAHSSRPDTIRTVICYTCHRGTHNPESVNLLPVLDSLMELKRRK